MTNLWEQIEDIAAFFSDYPNNMEISNCFSKLILRRVTIDGFPEPRQKIDVRCEFGFKTFLKGYCANRDYCSHFWLSFQATSKFVIVSVTLILPEVGVDRFTGPRRESGQIRKWFVTHIRAIKMEIEIIATIFQWFSKQQVNF